MKHLPLNDALDPIGLAAFSGGGVAPAWTPSNLGAALFGWWTADQSATVNTGSSNVWTAYAGTAGALTQATAADRGTYTNNVKLTFDSTDVLLLASAPAAYDAVALIKTVASNAGFRTLFWDTVSNHSLMFDAGGDAFGFYNGGFVTSGLSVPVSTTAIVHVRCNASGNISYSLNGNALTGTIVTPAAIDRPIACVGSVNTAGQAIGDIQAIVISSGVLSQSDLDKTIGSLAWEWGVQSLLPAGHPYKAARP